MNFEWWTVLYIGFVLFFSVIILLERRSPPKTVAWLFVLAFLPYLGFLFYMLFGRNWRKKDGSGKTAN